VLPISARTPQQRPPMNVRTRGQPLSADVTKAEDRYRRRNDTGGGVASLFNEQCGHTRRACHCESIRGVKCQRKTSATTVKWRSSDLESQLAGPRNLL